jgi:hypothetical protein
MAGNRTGNSKFPISLITHDNKEQAKKEGKKEQNVNHSRS